MRLGADLGRVVDNLPRLEGGPLVALDPDAHGGEDASGNENLESHALAVVHLRLGSPVEELDDVLGHLRGGGGGLVFVLDKIVVENTSHGNAGTGEVGVEVEAGTNLGTRGRLLRVTGQQGEDVVAATVAGLDDERQIRGQGTVVGEPGGFIVGVGRGKVVGELSRALLDLSLVVGLSVVLVLLSKSLGLVNGQDAADKCAVRNSAEGVARRANFSVDLETTAESVVRLILRLAGYARDSVHGLGDRGKPGDLRLVVKGLEPLLVNPWVLCWMKTVYTRAVSFDDLKRVH